MRAADRRTPWCCRMCRRPTSKARPSLRWSSASAARNVKAADAMSYVFGYTNFIDGSARGLKPPGNTFYQMKSRDTFAPIGPYIVTADEIKDPHKLQVRLWNNGELKQNFNTDDMAHKIPRCIEFVSSIHALEPGDILATGTNHRGLHAFQDGDKVELEIEGSAACASTCATTSSAPGRATRGWNGTPRAARANTRRRRPAATRRRRASLRTIWDATRPCRDERQGLFIRPLDRSRLSSARRRSRRSGRSRACPTRSISARARRCRRAARAPSSPCRRS